jgi:hypothetical protein
MEPSKSFRLPLVAIAEWLMVLPATVLLAAAALRVLQPPQYEPARTSLLIFEWTTGHISRLGAATLFILIPALVVFAGYATLRRAWREDQALRQDAILGLTIFGRHLAAALLTAATLLAASIFLLAVFHVVTD